MVEREARSRVGNFGKGRLDSRERGAAQNPGPSVIGANAG